MLATPRAGNPRNPILPSAVATSVLTCSMHTPYYSLGSSIRKLGRPGLGPPYNSSRVIGATRGTTTSCLRARAGLAGGATAGAPGTRSTAPAAWRAAEPRRGGGRRRECLRLALATGSAGFTCLGGGQWHRRHRSRAVLSGPRPWYWQGVLDGSAWGDGRRLGRRLRVFFILGICGLIIRRRSMISGRTWIGRPCASTMSGRRRSKKTTTRDTKPVVKCSTFRQRGAASNIRSSGSQSQQRRQRHRPSLASLRCWFCALAGTPLDAPPTREGPPLPRRRGLRRVAAEDRLSRSSGTACLAQQIQESST